MRARSAVAGFLALAGFLTGQNTPAPERPGTVIRTDVREVLLDVIVRHKNMSLVKNLKPSDFTITEDGVPQSIKTFGFAGDREARVIPQTPQVVGPAIRSAAPQANSLREPNFVSIVFDQIGPDTRKNALEAAADFLEQEFQGNTYAAIFALNLRLNAVQGFTNDRSALQAAVRKAVTGNSMELASASAGVLNQTNYTITGGRTGVSINAGTDVTQNPDLATSSAAQSVLSEGQQAIAGMIGSQRDMVAYGAGMQTMMGLLRLVQYESRLPGRKTVLYLSEGLVKPPGHAEVMRSVVGAANRGNVSFYCIDVRGLTAGTSNGMSTGLTRTAAGISRTQSVMSDSPSGAMAQANEFEVIQDSLAAHIQLNMAELAEGTGGFAVFNTNEFKKNMARIMEDVRTHYEISYVPASTIYDGHFRQIKVTVRDPNLIVQSRDGYFAVPDLGGQSVMPYEMAGLGALNGPPRHDFDFHAAALRFKPLQDGYRYEMAFSLDTGSLTTNVDTATHKARIHVVFLALIKDSGGQVINKVSMEIDRAVPEQKLEQFRRGQIIFTAPFEVASGRYTVETAVTDPEGGRVGTRRLSLVVPKPGEPNLSNISVVRRIDSLSGPRDPGNPLEFEGGQVLPALDQMAKAGAPTVLFFVVYPQAAGSAQPVSDKPKVSVEFLRDGRAVSRTQPELGVLDETNSLPVLNSVKLPAGDYVVRVTVEQGGRASRDETALSVTE